MFHDPHITTPCLTVRPPVLSSRPVPADGGVSVLDSLSHTLLSSIGATRPGKDWIGKMRDFEISLRKMAATHPMLLLRSVSVITDSASSGRRLCKRAAPMSVCLV